MKKIILISLSFLLTIVACNKEDIETTPIKESGKEKMTFAASPEGNSTKSYFGDVTNGVLYWNGPSDANPDNLGVFSYTQGNAFIHKGKATIVTAVAADATFQSSDPRSDWAGAGNPDDEITLCAYYPNNSATVAPFAPGSENTVVLNVSNTQNGVFGNHHILYSNPVTLTREKILDGETPNFKFNPVTSLLRIRPYLDATQWTSSVEATKLVVTIADGKQLAGDATLNVMDGSFTANGDNISSTIVINFDAPRTISTNKLLNDYVDIVVLPSNTNNAQLNFTIVTDGGDELKLQGKLSPSSFANGKRYTSDLMVNGAAKDLVYYGTANSLVLRNGESNGTLDVAPYITDAFFRYTGTSAPSAPKATQAKVLWEEIAGMIQNLQISGNSMTVTRRDPSTEFGNALVGIYDASDNLLWSYHIWCPEDDPFATLEYSRLTTSGVYHVMPMALGATKRMTTNATAEGLGLWFQWGRKDPLGRASGINSNTIKPVYDATGTQIDMLSTAYAASADQLLTNQYIGKDVSNPASPNYKTIARFIIEYSIANPTQHIAASLRYSWNWLCEPNHTLWGNPQPIYSFPGIAESYKTIFDPSPAGYRVPSQDAFFVFTSNGRNHTHAPYWEVVNPNFSSDRGYAFKYNRNDATLTDFYSANGYRNASTPDVSQVGINAYFWTSCSDRIMAYSLTFNSQQVCPWFQFDKGRAFGVRCVKE